MGQMLRSWRDTALLFLSIAGSVLAAGAGQWELFILALVLAAAFVAVLWVRRQLARSAGFWSWSVRRRHGSFSRPGEALGAVLRRVLGHDEMTRRAYDSLVWPGNDSQPRRPLLAPMASASRRKGWGVWAFATRVTTSGVRVFSDPVGKSGEKTLEVDLTEAPLGIYNNLGKRFLDVAYADRIEAGAEAVSKAALDALLGHEQPGEVTVGVNYPLRWASGGVLPVVEWRGRTWVALLLRDIRPTGWNIANGASESTEEQTGLARLAEREFCEELLVCTGPPLPGAGVSTRLFSFPGPNATDSVLQSRRFSKLHRKLREKHDGVHLPIAEGTDARPVALGILPTPWRVAVKDGHDTKPVPDVIPSVNPYEMGIECVRVLRFAIGDDEVLLDGEILEEGYLARRPVALFCVETLRGIFSGEDGRALEAATRDRMLLPILEAGEFHIFHSDIESREQRLVSPSASPEERAMIEEWMTEYRNPLLEPTLSAPAVRLLCPVSWKTLKAAFDAHVL